MAASPIHAGGRAAAAGGGAVARKGGARGPGGSRGGWDRCSMSDEVFFAVRGAVNFRGPGSDGAVGLAALLKAAWSTSSPLFHLSFPKFAGGSTTLRHGLREKIERDITPCTHKVSEREGE